jgi:hypothetical protein
MKSKEIEHDTWILDIAQHDSFAFLWALGQGWGELFEPRPSVLKNMTIIRTHALIDSYFADLQKTEDDRMDIKVGKHVWDDWLRLASKRNTWLITLLYSPLHNELEQVAQCRQPVSFPLHFWQRVEALYPGIQQMREETKNICAGLGIVHGTVEDKAVLGKAMGVFSNELAVIPMAFEPSF